MTMPLRHGETNSKNDWYAVGNGMVGARTLLSIRELFCNAHHCTTMGITGMPTHPFGAHCLHFTAMNRCFT